MKNSRGTVLVIAVVATMIMIIVGAVCLKIYMNQSILDTYDVTKKRVFYSAEGMIEFVRGFINFQTAGNDNLNNGQGYLLTNADVNNSGTINDISWWTTGNLPVIPNNIFDGTLHPDIRVAVAVRRLTVLAGNVGLNRLVNSGYFTSADGQNFLNAINNNTPNATDNRSYEIIAKAYADHDTVLGINNRISATIHCYFYTSFDDTTGNIHHNPIIVGWRIE